MEINRRLFLKYCISSATVLGLNSSIVGKLEQALAGDPSTMPTIIWIEGSSCSGCSVSLANLIGSSKDGGPIDVADLLINYLNVSFAKTFMTAAGHTAVEALRAAQKGNYVLVVEGSVPTAFDGLACTVWHENGHEVTMKSAVEQLAPKAGAVLCVGACASFGGIPAAQTELGVKSVSEIIGSIPGLKKKPPLLNLPGCPVHPDWLVGTVASILCGEIPDVDKHGRPLGFFGKTIHSQCPRKPLYDKKNFADNFGQEGRCLYKLGCKGPVSYADCPSRGWNNGFNYCTQSNANCIGCVEKDFPKSSLVTRL